MAKSDPTEILLAHNRWATQQVLDACAGLTDEQFHQSFDMGVGSLHDTVAHILDAMRGWTDMLAGREFREDVGKGKKSVAELKKLVDESSDDLEKVAKAHPLDEIVTRERGGQDWSFTRGAVVTHVTTHGVHHRAQCANMLRRLGVDPLPSTSVTGWTFEVDPITA